MSGADTTPDWSDEEHRLLAEHLEGRTVVVHMRRCRNLVAWATDRGVYVRIDRRSKWGNPWPIGPDADRAAVIARYEAEYLPTHPELLAETPTLAGKVLGCWCAPLPCHGDVLARLAVEAVIR